MFPLTSENLAGRSKTQIARKATSNLNYISIQRIASPGQTHRSESIAKPVRPCSVDFLDGGETNVPNLGPMKLNKNFGNSGVCLTKITEKKDTAIHTLFKYHN